MSTKGCMPDRSEFKLNCSKQRFTDGDVVKMPMKQDDYLYEEVDFSQNSLTSEGLNAVLELCGRCQKLRVLKLFKNRLDDVGAEALASLVRKCPSLEEMHLSHNCFTGKGVESIVESADRSRPEKAQPLWLRLEQNDVVDPNGLIQRLQSRYSLCARKDERSCTVRQCVRRKKIHLPFFDLQRGVKIGGGKGGGGGGFKGERRRNDRREDRSPQNGDKGEDSQRCVVLTARDEIAGSGRSRAGPPPQRFPQARGGSSPPRSHRQERGEREQRGERRMRSPGARAERRAERSAHRSGRVARREQRRGGHTRNGLRSPSPGAHSRGPSRPTLDARGAKRSRESRRVAPGRTPPGSGNRHRSPVCTPDEKHERPRRRRRTPSRGHGVTGQGERGEDAQRVAKKRRRRSSRSCQRGVRLGGDPRRQQPQCEPRGRVGVPPQPPEDRRCPRDQHQELPLSRCQSLSPPVMGVRRAPPPPPPRSELPLAGTYGGNRSLRGSSAGSSYSCSEDLHRVSGITSNGAAAAPATSAKAPPPPRPPVAPSGLATKTGAAHGDDDLGDESDESEDESAASFASGSQSRSPRDEVGQPGQRERTALASAPVGPSIAPAHAPADEPPSSRSMARSPASSESSRDNARRRGDGRGAAPATAANAEDIVSLSPSDDERRWEEDQGCSPPSGAASRSRSRGGARGMPAPGTRAAQESNPASGLRGGQASVEDKMQRLKDRLTQKWQGGKRNAAA